MLNKNIRDLGQDNHNNLMDRSFHTISPFIICLYNLNISQHIYTKDVVKKELT